MRDMAANPSIDTGSNPQMALPNGPGTAAVLAVGFGSLALGVFSFAGDAVPAIGQAFNIWNPSGPLSGVTTATVVVWPLAW